MANNATVPRAMIVYESMFGNTRTIAEEIGKALADLFTVEVVDVVSAPPVIEDVDLLVVGGPTHAFGMSRPGTRVGARDKGAAGSAERGVREWLAAVTVVSAPALAAAFDTRVRSPLPGSARRPILRRLRRLGLRVAKPASFVVTGTAGPLAEGELESARRWAATLTEASVASAVRR
ncbi:MAG: flavodoxin domain-containing protein [Ilumatobacteraceae bacterium]